MRRRRRGPGSSLGLLLDTICNTFGGVLFVAMLLAVLLQTTTRFRSSSDSTPTSELELLTLAEKQKAALAKLESREYGGSFRRRALHQALLHQPACSTPVDHAFAGDYGYEAVVEAEFDD